MVNYSLTDLKYLEDLDYTEIKEILSPTDKFKIQDYNVFKINVSPGDKTMYLYRHNDDKYLKLPDYTSVWHSNNFKEFFEYKTKIFSRDGSGRFFEDYNQYTITKISGAKVDNGPEPEIDQQGGNANKHKVDIKHLRKLLKNKNITDKQKEQYLKKIDNIKIKIQTNKDKINKCKEHIKNLQKTLKNKQITEKQKQQCHHKISNYKIKIEELK
jgi:hypothetical protein